MRIEQQRIGNITVINDAYNANPASMDAALATLVEMAGSGSRHVRENYSVAALSHQLAELYDAALKSPDGNTHGKT